MFMLCCDSATENTQRFHTKKKTQIKTSQQKFNPYSATTATNNSFCRTLHKILDNAEHCGIN